MVGSCVEIDDLDALLLEVDAETTRVADSTEGDDLRGAFRRLPTDIEKADATVPGADNGSGVVVQPNHVLDHGVTLIGAAARDHDDVGTTEPADGLPQAAGGQARLMGLFGTYGS